jgi:hypothetical protein
MTAMMTVQVCEVMCWRHAQYAARVGITDLSGAERFVLTADLKVSQARIRIRRRNVNVSMKRRDRMTRRVDTVLFIFGVIFLLFWLIARILLRG